MVNKGKEGGSNVCGETLENVERYKDGMIYIVGGEKYVIWCTSDLIHPEDYEV